MIMKVVFATIMVPCSQLGLAFSWHDGTSRYPQTCSSLGLDSGRSKEFAEWVYNGGICGTQVYPTMTRKEWQALLQLRAKENCAVIELDTVLSFYLSDDEFAAQASLIDEIASESAKLGMKTSIYYPSLEIVTNGGETDPNSAGRVMAEWLQVGLDGTPNVFYGGKEFWVEPGAESAWFDPASPYVEEYLLPRLRTLALTSVDSLWMDVPLYYEMGAAWAAGGSSWAGPSFRKWSRSKGYCGKAKACSLPDAERVAEGVWDYTEYEFKAWLTWRHVALADLTKKIRDTVATVNASTVVFIENFPCDVTDAVLSGLDASFLDASTRAGTSVVWEVDSVSPTTSMKYAHPEDVANQITIRKFGRAVDRRGPSWAFSYGYEPLDQEMTLASAMVVGQPPLETFSMTMAQTVNSEVRSRVYGWINRYSCAIMEMPRSANVAVFYSHSTRNTFDHETSGGYCLFTETKLHTDETRPMSELTPQEIDNLWWSTWPEDSVVNCPFIGAYRAASYGLQRKHVQFTMLLEQGLKPSDLEGIELVWMPTIVALQDDAVEIISDWVAEGGTLLATGETLPAIKNELGLWRNQSAFAQAFSGPAFGKGRALFLPQLNPRDFFTLQGGSANAQQAAERILDSVLDLAIGHTTERTIRITNGAIHIHVELSKAQSGVQFIYLFNYRGAQQPVVEDPQEIEFSYNPPSGKRVTNIWASTPSDPNAGEVPLRFERKESGAIQTRLTVNWFHLVTVNLQ